MDEATRQRAGKSCKQRAARPAGRPEGEPPAKRKTTFHLSVEASQRLDVHCTMANLDRSAMVEKLISEHLRRYVVSDRGGAPAQPIRIADETPEAGRRESA